MLSARSLTASYGETQVLDGVTFDVEVPTAISGPSGSGKSTLLRILAGAQVPDSGSVSLDGTPIAVPTWFRAGDQRIGLIHQDYRLVEFLTVQENIELASEARGRETDTSAIVEALEQVALDVGFLDRWPATLSGGEQQRVAIARALITNPRLIVADEPTGALDKANSRLVTELLLDATRARNALLVVASHDPTVVERFPKSLRLEGGMVEDCTGL
jgi:putative ABC transport system ATP-binding protein